jgi:RNA polymerase sigma factor (sigma-70 family)
MENAELLREYVERRSEAAFTALVARHINLVYSTARRMVGDAHLAQDVAQTVFIGLARAPAKVRQPAALAGWLYAATRNTAARAVRTEQRRQQRETEAMNRQLLDDHSPAAWEAVAPLLDEAMRELKPIETDAIVLRFFEGKSLRDTGLALDLSENAAQKRVERALEKIRGYFARRGVTASAALLGATIAANSVQAAPAGLAENVAGASLAGARVDLGVEAGAGVATENIFLKILLMSTKTKLVLAAVVLLMVVSLVIFRPASPPAVATVANPKSVSSAPASAPVKPPAPAAPVLEPTTAAVVPTNPAVVSAPAEPNPASSGPESPDEVRADLAPIIADIISKLQANDVSVISDHQPPDLRAEENRAAAARGIDLASLPHVPIPMFQLLIKELESIQNTNPELNKAGDKASYIIDPAIMGNVRSGDEAPGDPHRVLFQKVNGQWYYIQG